MTLREHIAIACLVPLFLTGLASLAWAGAEPVDDPARVNTLIPGTQFGADVSTGLPGSRVTVWASEGLDGDGLGIGARVFGVGGGDIKVNPAVAGDQRNPAVSQLVTGEFTVVWERPFQTQDSISMRRFNASGNGISPEFTVRASSSSGTVAEPDVAHGPAGDFVVAWVEEDATDGVFARQYLLSGAPFTLPFAVGTTGTSWKSPRVSRQSDSKTVIVWEAQIAANVWRVYGTILDFDGTIINPEFQVGPELGNDLQPDVSHAPNGEFVVAWSRDGDIVAKRFTEFGVPLSTQIPVSTLSSNSTPSIDHGPDGDFVVSWRRGTDIFARCFDASGNPMGDVFVVQDSGSTITSVNVIYPSANDLVFSWDENRTGTLDVWEQPFAVGTTGIANASGAPSVRVGAFGAPSVFRSQTTIRYELGEPSPVTLRIFDAQGRLVRTLIDAPRSAGTHRELWDGRNQSGASVASGAYFFTLRAGGRAEVTGRLVRSR